MSTETRLIVIANEGGYLVIDSKVVDGFVEFSEMGLNGSVGKRGRLPETWWLENRATLLEANISLDNLPVRVVNALRFVTGLLASKCMGSGYCCVKAQCQVSLQKHGVQKLCPELDWNGSRHVCKLMLLPGNEGEFYRKGLYAGEGCSSSLNSWRREPLKDRRSLPTL
jgi:hypothetical protein